MSKAYISGEQVEVEEAHEHVLPLPVYFKVFGALMVLTLLTVGVSYVGLGPASLAVAMFVAIIKAGLVVGFFMHLRYDDRLHSFVFFSTVLFVAIFFILTMADVSTRDSLQPDWGNSTLIEEKIDGNPKLHQARENFFNEGAHH